MYVSSCQSVDMRIETVKNEQVRARGWTSARFSETPLQTFFQILHKPIEKCVKKCLKDCVCITKV